MQIPTFAEEERLQADGYRLIAGIDEVGRGAMAGPVVAAAIILPHQINAPWMNQVRDSKQLSPAIRELLFPHIYEAATAVGLGIVDHEIIDSQGIAKATRLAMKLAVEQLLPSPECLLIDYMRLPEVTLPQRGIPKGDCQCFSIACASIIAKVTRDRLMTQMDEIYPGYGLARHKGYCTNRHCSRLYRLGPSPIHRQSFRPVKDIIER